jgi:hypothetical protein
MFSKLTAAVIFIGALTSPVVADSHTITVHNKCGYGTPMLFGPAGAQPWGQVRLSEQLSL